VVPIASAQNEHLLYTLVAMNEKGLKGSGGYLGEVRAFHKLTKDGGCMWDDLSTLLQRIRLRKVAVRFHRSRQKL
jgi:hypothetical protein